MHTVRTHGDKDATVLHYRKDGEHESDAAKMRTIGPRCGSAKKWAKHLDNHSRIREGTQRSHDDCQRHGSLSRRRAHDSSHEPSKRHQPEYKRGHEGSPAFGRELCQETHAF